MSLSIIVIYYFTGMAPVNADKINTIAVLDFQSNNVDEKFAKIIRNELEYNLFQAKDFRILEREKIDIVIKENKIKGIEKNKQDILISIGKTLSAEYILAGEIKKEENILINLRIINVIDGTVLYFYPEKLNDISKIKNFSSSISDTIISDLRYFITYGKTKSLEKIDDVPSLRLKKVNEKLFSKKINVTIYPEFIYPLGKFSHIVQYGYGVGICGGIDNLLNNNVEVGIDSGIIKLNHKNNNSNYFIGIPLLLNIEYSYIFFNNYNITPALKAGTVYFFYHDNNKADTKTYNQNAIEAMSIACISLGREVTYDSSVSISTGYGIIIEKENILNFITLSICIKYNF